MTPHLHQLILCPLLEQTWIQSYLNTQGDNYTYNEYTKVLILWIILGAPVYCYFCKQQRILSIIWSIKPIGCIWF